jgi:hypothetical protein
MQLSVAVQARACAARPRRFSDTGRERRCVRYVPEYPDLIALPEMFVCLLRSTVDQCSLLCTCQLTGCNDPASGLLLTISEGQRLTTGILSVSSGSTQDSGVLL